MAERKTLLIAPTRDTHANWLLNNPILPEGVLGIVKGRLSEDSLEFVIVDGITAYDELAKSGQSITTVIEQYIEDNDITVNETAVTEIVNQLLTSNNYATETAVTEIVNQALASYVAAKIMTSIPSASDLNEGEIAYVVEA